MNLKKFKLRITETWEATFSGKLSTRDDLSSHDQYFSEDCPLSPVSTRPVLVMTTIYLTMVSFQWKRKLWKTYNFKPIFKKQTKLYHTKVFTKLLSSILYWHNLFTCKIILILFFISKFYAPIFPLGVQHCTSFFTISINRNFQKKLFYLDNCART